MGNLSREVTFDPPLVMFSKSGRASWNRQPLQPLDVSQWRSAVQVAEQFAPPVQRLRSQRLASNAGLLDWVRQHRHLRPVALDQGEFSMVLLILWEVDHKEAFPSQGGRDRASILVAFTRRLKTRVQGDPQLQAKRRWGKRDS